MLDPAVDVLWDAVGSVVTVEGTFEKAPATDDDWAGVRASAIQLAESGNLLMMATASGGSRGVDHRRPRRSSTHSKRAIQAIDKKDKDALFTIGGDLYDVCTNCHRQFMRRASRPVTS